MSTDCIICRKHQDIDRYTGGVIAEKSGLILAHFPFLEGEKAAKGHLIIEPRRHIVDFHEMTDEEASSLGALVQRGSRAIQKALGAEHVYLYRINDKVQHLHFHLIPRYPETPREYWGLKIGEWPAREILNLEQIKDVSLRLKAFC